MYYHQWYGLDRKKFDAFEVFDVDSQAIDVISRIQKSIQKEVAGRNICIEANLSSNLRICNIPQYAAHPILTLNDYGLPQSKRDHECPLISLTLSTDDKGTFGTSLDKEYTLLALSMLKIEDEKGNPKFSLQEVVDWLGYLRRESISRSFIN